MLTTTFYGRPTKLRTRQRQGGVVLVIAIIVLVAMTLAALAMVRSVDTSNVIAGNLAFQQSATHSGDAGVEAAVQWLESRNNGSILNTDIAAGGYSASGNAAAQNPAAGQTWDAFWTATLAARAVRVIPGDDPADGAGNVVSYVIDRMCNIAGSKTAGAGCVESPVVLKATTNAQEANEVPISFSSVVYYRITVRIAGPRNTVSYVQSVVSM